MLKKCLINNIIIYYYLIKIIIFIMKNCKNNMYKICIINFKNKIIVKIIRIKRKNFNKYKII